MKTKIFNPIESMNPIYLGAADDELYQEILKEQGGETFAEIKEDGYRVQIHKLGDKIRGYTRSMNTILLNLFPELNSSLQKLPDCILDAELIGDNKIGHSGFKLVKKRFRHKMNSKGIEKYFQTGMVENMPLALRVFDTLYWEENDLVNNPLKERRKYTENILEKKIIPSTQRLVKNPGKLKQWFEELVGKKYEGLVCKNPNSAYLAGKRTTDWIKLKRSETLDLVVLGVYLDKGKISQLLCGTFNTENGKYETLAKVNAKRNSMNRELHPLLVDYFTETIPEEIKINPEMMKRPERIPDYFISPKKSAVVEVAAMNFHQSKNWHSCGLENGKSYSLRIGWLKDIRDDKTIKQIMTTEQIKQFYLNEIKES